MRRIKLLLSTLFLVAVALPAHAGWVQQEIQWRRTGVGPTGTSTGIWVRDTSYTLFNGNSVLDTTGNFTLDDATPVAIGSANGGVSNGRSDSLVCGYLVFQQDTSSTTAATLVAVTVAIDGKVGGYGSTANVAGWTAVDTVSVGIQTGGTAVAIPIRALSSISPGPLGYSTLRARTTTGVGILHQCRAFFRYWKP